MRKYLLLLVGLLLPVLGFAATVTVNVSVSCVVTSKSADGKTVLARVTLPGVNICSSTRSDNLEVTLGGGQKVVMPAGVDSVPVRLPKSADTPSVTAIRVI